MSNIFQDLESGKILSVKIYISRDGDVNIKNASQETLLHGASFKGLTTIVKLLLDNGAHANAKTNEGETALHYLMRNKESNEELEIAKLLLNAGLDINAQNSKNGKTALFYAVALKSFEVVKYLIDTKANVNLKNINGDTVLIYAAACRDADVINLLLKSGANVMAQNKHGETALHAAAMTGNVKAIKPLKDSGVDLDAQNKYGGTALMYALGQGKNEFAKQLIAVGAKVDIKDHNGKTALDICTDSEMRKLIEDAMEKQAAEEAQKIAVVDHHSEEGLGDAGVKPLGPDETE